MIVLWIISLQFQKASDTRLSSDSKRNAEIRNAIPNNMANCDKPNNNMSKTNASTKGVRNNAVTAKPLISYTVLNTTSVLQAWWGSFKLQTKTS